MSNTKNTRKSNTATAIVDSVVDSAFVPDMESNKTRETLGYEQKKQVKRECETIVSYVPMRGKGSSIRASVNREIEAKAKKLPNGLNSLKLLGCTYVFETDSGREWYDITVRGENGAEQSLKLFPGNRYVDRKGAVHEAGERWVKFYAELDRQRREEGKALEGEDLDAAFRLDCTKGFKTWILFDGKYTNMYITEYEYDYAVKKLAIAAGADKAPWEE